jgi:hypothetical protein
VACRVTEEPNTDPARPNKAMVKDQQRFVPQHEPDLQLRVSTDEFRGSRNSCARWGLSVRLWLVTPWVARSRSQWHSTIRNASAVLR